MSIKVMTAVWEDEQLDPTETLVMLAMADWSNDHGKCWPSLPQLMKKTRLSERGLREIIRRLVDMAVLEKVDVVGRGTNYVVRPRHYVPPRHEMPPAPNAATPARGAANTSVKHHSSEAKASSVSRAKSFADAVPSTLSQAEATVWACNTMSWSKADANVEWERFSDSAQAADRKYVDWKAAWRNWCRSPFCKTKSAEEKTAYRKEPMRV